MALKEDILEQLVEEYLLHKGYFVQHNVKFRPSENHRDYDKRSDSNHSDIDVLGFHPRFKGAKRVVAVSCKSWQNGFNPASELKAFDGGKVVSGRPRWKSYRELLSPKWSEAFIQAIYEATGCCRFTYITAVTKVVGDRSLWEENTSFQQAIGGNPIQVLDVRQLIAEITPTLTTTLAGTAIGRTLQLIKAANIALGHR